jgi:hypothetical protein
MPKSVVCKKAKFAATLIVNVDDRGMSIPPVSNKPTLLFWTLDKIEAKKERD